MRAFRAVVAVLLSAVVLAGCGPSAPGGGDDAPPASATAPPATGPATGPPPGGGTTASPAPTSPAATGPGATPGRTPSATETLVRVSRSGGFAGDTHTLIVTGDGSWTRHDRMAKPEGGGKLSESRLAELRTALREADFAALPRISTSDPKIFDGFSYTFVHGGFEVAGDQEALPPVLTKVLEALPPFTAG
ncbi:hypothetical protein [Streptomyces sp. NBC_01408]|uniref:hypothetical protein n=1 Tax=Streptomyces sp. NBC_01408 TaxID=2903855 RepID=UPI00224E757E|nr:hypothetical protein [Streptomyces sp. NBC_01408]MCX4691033.1 hypothetical protein [Streptomyces sp. NBC_01408]